MSPQQTTANTFVAFLKCCTRNDDTTIWQTPTNDISVATSPSFDSVVDSTNHIAQGYHALYSMIPVGSSCVTVGLGGFRNNFAPGLIAMTMTREWDDIDITWKKAVDLGWDY